MESCRKAIDAQLARVSTNDSYERIVTVASNYQLSRQSHVQRLAIVIVEKNIPRRRLVPWIETVIAKYEGRIVWATGVEFKFGEFDIYEAFAVKEDPSQRWVGDFYKFSVKPPKQVAQNRVVDRFRYIDLAVRIEYPEQAESIAK